MFWLIQIKLIFVNKYKQSARTWADVRGIRGHGAAAHDLQQIKVKNNNL